MTVITELVAGVVGIGGLAFGWKQSTLTLGHQRTLADLAATRDLLEQAAVHLHHVAYALDLVRQDLDGNAVTALEELSTLGKQHDELVARMEVRLAKNHEVTRRFRGAVEAELEVVRGLGGYVRSQRHVERDALALRQVQAHMDRDRASIIAARESFDTHRAEFIDAASRTAGAQLPSR